MPYVGSRHISAESYGKRLVIVGQKRRKEWGRERKSFGRTRPKNGFGCLELLIRQNALFCFCQYNQRLPPWYSA